MKKYVCIHGHFYQPPRENAWLEHIEIQESAQPYDNWNERINYECYSTNTAARILNKQGLIEQIINNYAYISHNFGPTLLSWMQEADPKTYKKIIEADKEGSKHFSGYGPALAQVYSHLIMPLTNQRDKETQVVWGIRDFVARYDRQPDGMWLAETAVDIPTLEVLAAHGIKYTILAPRQAKAVRRLTNDSSWHQVDENSLDTRRVYTCKLPSGAQIALFFYDGNISKGVAFDGLLNNGKAFAKRLTDAFSDADEPQLVHIATDGESYGHHHRHGEMALADCMQTLLAEEDVQVTVYAEFLEKHPPQWEVEIHENSSWSCIHGIERWRTNCGCHSGRGEWHQLWREPLREALDDLRESLIHIFERECSALLTRPWEARNAYFSVIHDRSIQNVQRFLNEYATPEGKKKPTKVLRLLEMQRQAIQMYTSCGWFFDEISGIETVQILQYALRAITFAKQVTDEDLLPYFREMLEKAPSNVLKDGAYVLKKKVLPSQVTLERVGIHIAANALFAANPERISLYNYTAENHAFERQQAGNYTLALGQASVRSRITWSEKHFSFVVLHLGQQQMVGHISKDLSTSEYAEMCDRIMQAFSKPDLEHVLVLMNEYFENQRFSFRDLFHDEKHRILRQLAAASIDRTQAELHTVYADNYPMMSAMRTYGLPLPRTMRQVAIIVLNADLLDFFEGSSQYLPDLRQTIQEMENRDIQVNAPEDLGIAIRQRMHIELNKLEEAAFLPKQLRLINDLLVEVQRLDFGTALPDGKFDPWPLQNRVYRMKKTGIVDTFSNEQIAEWQFLKANLGIR